MPEPLQGDGLEASLTVRDDGAKGLDRAKGEGLSLPITTSQSVDAVAAEIAWLGGVLDTEPTTMPWGVRIIRFRDPMGFASRCRRRTRPRISPRAA